MYLVNYILNALGNIANSKNPLQKHFCWFLVKNCFVMQINIL